MSTWSTPVPVIEPPKSMAQPVTSNEGPTYCLSAATRLVAAFCADEARRQSELT
jgi:hypothetical protein